MSLQIDPESSANILEYQRPGLAATLPPRLRGGDVLACGFGITVAVWITAYVSRLPLVSASGQTSVTLMLLMVLVGGALTARYSPRGIFGAILAGGLSGMLDILIVGSLIHDYTKTHDQSLVPSAALWIGGSVVLNAIVAGLGGIIGALVPSARRNDIHWTQVFAIVLTAATLPLITAGGLVTAFRAGLAVPDWPQSYHFNMFLFPLSLMQKNDGTFYEHSHRLMGSLVGLTSLVLAIYMTLAERRRWIKVLAWSIFVAVCVQGVLGGTRVTERNLTLAITHGVFAQVVFASMAALAAATGRSALRTARVTRLSASTDRVLTIALLGLMLTQLILGALLRHRNELLMMHIIVASLVLLMSLTCGVRAWGIGTGLKPLVRSGMFVMTIVGVQIVLGIIALIFRSEPGEEPTVRGALLTTAHQANGALLFASCAVLAFWTWRLLVPPTPAPASVAVPAPQPAITY